MWLAFPLPSLRGEVQLIIRIGNDEVSSTLEFVGPIDSRVSSSLVYEDLGRIARVRDYVTSLPFEDMLSVAKSAVRKANSTLIYVTGSVGKTSTKEALAGLLRYNHRVISSTDSWNHAHEMCSQIVTNSSHASIFLFELAASHLLPVVGRVLPPHILILTHLGQGHASISEDLLEVGRIKLSLTSHMVDGLILYNAESEPLTTLVQEKKEQWQERGNRVIKISQAKSVLCEVAQGLCPQGQTPKGLIDRIQASGLAFTNAVCCLATGTHLGITSHALDNWPQKTPHRFETITYTFCTLIKDAYNANPLSMARFLDAVASYPLRSRKLVILGEMLDLGERSFSQHQNVVERLQESTATYYLLGETYRKVMPETQDNCRIFSSVDSLRNEIFSDQDTLTKWDMIAIKGSAATGLRALSDEIGDRLRQYDSSVN